MTSTYTAVNQALRDQALTEANAMTWERWQSLSANERAMIVRHSNAFHHKLLGFEGERVEVTYSEPTYPLCLANHSKAWQANFEGKVTVERFRVGKSTGWKPCHLALYNRRSMGGDAVASSAPIASVRRIGK